MTVRFLIVFSAIMSFAALAVGGAFQKTRDGKTTVWNEHPKNGDAASWVGGRDDEGYAKGFGTLTWYREEGGKLVVYARYFGNAVRGKFEGGVNAHSNGKTSHAFFTEGTRTSPWATGTAPLLGAGPEKKTTRAKKERALAAEESEPRETPSAKRPVPNLEKTHEQVAIAGSPVVTPQPTEKPRQEEKKSIPREARSTPTPPPIAEKAETPVVGESSATPSSTPEPIVAETRNQPTPHETEAAIPAPSVVPSPTAPMVAQKEEATPRPPEPTPPAIPTPKPLRSPPKKTASSAKPKRAVDDSLRSLAGPPSSLRKNSVSEAQAPNRSSTNPPLSKNEVIDLADTVARTHGYNLGDFEHAPPEYDEVDETWSVSYDEKAGDSSSGGKRFTVRVDGRTKKSMLFPAP